MSLTENLKKIKESLPENVTLVAVSKTKPAEDILTLYNAGHLDFGENKVQEMVEKQQVLPEDIRWHLIGSLQRNKVKYMAPFVHLIHSVDSLRLLKEINKQAKRHDRLIDCLLQIKIAKEDTKSGMEPDEAEEILKSYKEELNNIRIIGLMGMGTFTDDRDLTRSEFHYLKQEYDKLKAVYPELETLSMGMSGDYDIALEEGSTMLRVGSSIFGDRDYSA